MKSFLQGFEKGLCRETPSRELKVSLRGTKNQFHPAMVSVNVALCNK